MQFLLKTRAVNSVRPSVRPTWWENSVRGNRKTVGKIPPWWEISLSGRKKVFRCMDHLVLRHPSYMRGFTYPFSLSVTARQLIPGQPGPQIIPASTSIRLPVINLLGWTKSCRRQIPIYSLLIVKINTIIINIVWLYTVNLSQYVYFFKLHICAAKNRYYCTSSPLWCLTSCELELKFCIDPQIWRAVSLLHSSFFFERGCLSNNEIDEREKERPARIVCM